MKNTLIILITLIAFLNFFSCSKNDSTSASTTPIVTPTPTPNYLLGRWVYDTIIDYNDGTVRDSCRLIGKGFFKVDTTQPEYTELTFSTDSSVIIYTPNRPTITSTSRCFLNSTKDSLIFTSGTNTISFYVSSLTSTTLILTSYDKIITCRNSSTEIVIPFTTIFKKR